MDIWHGSIQKKDRSSSPKEKEAEVLLPAGLAEPGVSQAERSGRRTGTDVDLFRTTIGHETADQLLVRAGWQADRHHLIHTTVDSVPETGLDHDRHRGNIRVPEVGGEGVLVSADEPRELDACANAERRGAAQDLKSRIRARERRRPGGVVNLKTRRREAVSRILHHFPDGGTRGPSRTECR